jgi:glucose 1-dehydrogenase
MTEENKNYSTSKDYRDNNEQTRIAIVTGSSRGIGKAIAQEFATAGYNVVLNAREESELSSAAEDIKKAVGKKSSSLQSITYLAGDISDEKTCSSLINHAIKTFGKVDVLINNAGIGGAQKTIHNLTIDEWDYVLDVNLKGAFLCTREAVKNMASNRGRNDNLSIINISSVHESIPQPEAAPYAASKGGMEMLTKTIALELADKGIRVNGIAPGAIATDMNKDMLEDQQKRSEEEQKIPMHRIGKPEEIAKVALFLASENARYITGTTIYVDGGLSLTS